MLVDDRGHGADPHCTGEPFIDVVANVPRGMISVIATLPSAKSAQQPLVLLVLPGCGSVTLSVLASLRRNCIACRFLALLIVHLPDGEVQPPPLDHIHSDHSAWASSEPSGRQ